MGLLILALVLVPVALLIGVEAVSWLIRGRPKYRSFNMGRPEPRQRNDARGFDVLPTDKVER